MPPGLSRNANMIEANPRDNAPALSCRRFDPLREQSDIGQGFRAADVSGLADRGGPHMTCAVTRLANPRRNLKTAGLLVQSLAVLRQIEAFAFFIGADAQLAHAADDF
jgi:hypothetical protein